MSIKIRNIKTGELYCTRCSRYDCICMDDDKSTVLEYKVRLNETEKAVLFLLKNQRLPNKRKIPTGLELWIPKSVICKEDDLFRTVVVENKYLNGLKLN